MCHGAERTRRIFLVGLLPCNSAAVLWKALVAS